MADSDSNYVDVSDIRARLNITDSQDDTRLLRIGAAVSRWIDRDRDTRFYTPDSDQTRYFTARSYGVVWIDDAVQPLTTVSVALTGTRTYTDWTEGTEFEVDPLGAATGDRIRALRIVPGSGKAFPRYRQAVKVTGKFGYSDSAPDAIREAATLLTMRIWRRKDAVFGVAGAPGLGVQVVLAEIGQDGDVRTLLETIPRRSYVGAF